MYSYDPAEELQESEQELLVEAEDARVREPDAFRGRQRGFGDGYRRGGRVGRSPAMHGAARNCYLPVWGFFFMKN